MNTPIPSPSARSFRRAGAAFLFTASLLGASALALDTPKTGLYKGALTAVHSVQHGGSPTRIAKVASVSKVVGIASDAEGGNQPIFDLVSPGFTVAGHLPVTFVTFDLSTTPARLRLLENGLDVDIPVPEVSVKGNVVTASFESASTTGEKKRTSRYVMRLVRVKP